MHLAEFKSLWVAAWRLSGHSRTHRTVHRMEIKIKRLVLAAQLRCRRQRRVQAETNNHLPTTVAELADGANNGDTASETFTLYPMERAGVPDSQTPCLQI